MWLQPFGDDSRWDTVVSFKVELHVSASCTSGAIVLPARASAEVIIINDDVFSGFKVHRADTADLIPSVQAFFSHVWRVKRSAFLKCLGYNMHAPLCFLIG